MKKENKIIRFLIPVVAVVVMGESIMLISNLNSKNTAKTVANDSQAVVSPIVTGTDQVSNQKPVYEVAVVSSPAGEMKLNQTSSVEVKALGDADESLDSINVYLKYDPTAFVISGLSYDKKLPAPTFSKVSSTTGLVVVNFLISAPSGLKVNAGEELSLMKFSAKPIRTGDFTFEVSTGSEMKEAATMFVQNATSKVLPFTSNKLTITVSR